MLDFAMMAYSDMPASNIFKKIQTINCRKIGVQYFIGRNDDTLLISFRGSDSPKDWKINARFWRKRSPYGNYLSKIRVHSGFIDAYQDSNVRENIHKAVTDDISKICVTGHSLGAALAALCALDLQYNFSEKLFEVTLFGCPRVGNGAFASSYNKRLAETMRFENGNDIVTKIPPAIFGFRHVGTKLHIGAMRILGVFSVIDHKMSKYYESLCKKGFDKS
jgi:predicted lipase